jgi:hypothetical protein
VARPSESKTVKTASAFFMGVLPWRAVDTFPR